MGLFNLFTLAKTVLVIDTVSLNESLGMKGNVPPRNQLQTLRRLARFSQREKLGMVAVLCGSPLIKAPEGKKFEEITVTYSKTPEGHARYLVKTVRSHGSGAILVSGNAEAEKLLGGAAKKLRMTTFRKAFDTGGDLEQAARERSASSGRGKRSSRKAKQKQDNDQPKQERPPKDRSDADAINELIDLVD